ncbi:MAG: hypothetical protein U0T73_13075 [Chitinophagales bacterium]
MGYYYTNLKGLEKVNGEQSLIGLVYNIKRTLNILDFEDLMEELKSWQPNYKRIAFFSTKPIHFKTITASFYFELKLSA